jgi:hypothetical protein
MEPRELGIGILVGKWLTRLDCRSGGFRHTIERRQLVDLMVEQLSSSELERDTSDIWSIPDLDYSSTDEMLNLTRGLQEFGQYGQYVLERGPPRVSVSFGALVTVSRADSNHSCL